MEIDKVLDKANECLRCKNPMCRNGCPIATNIPDFIYEVKQSNFKEAYKILQENNLMSEICSTVCPVENQCMGKCIKGIKGKPVEINYIEKFVNNWAKENNIIHEINIENTINKRVAIIGSGPAGLACAIVLRKAGIGVTVFEKEEKCGGILTYGIPDFRLSKDIVEGIIEKLKKIDIKFITSIEFGKDITIENLKEQGFDYIFLAMGAEIQSSYKLVDTKIDGIYKSDEFLKKYNTGKYIKNLGTTVVIGGGNVALDSARAAVHMGAKEVYILYRRNKELMPSREIELQEAIEEGVKVIFQTKVISAKEKNGNLTEIECIKTKIVEEKAIDVEGSNYLMPADAVVFAIGAKPNQGLLEEIKFENGLVWVDKNYKTNIDNVYAGGDMVETKSSVCRAIATGKKAANSIIENIK